MYEFFLPVCISVHHVLAWYPQKPEDLGYQDMNPGALQEQPVLLSAELSLQPLGDAILQAALVSFGG